MITPNCYTQLPVSMSVSHFSLQHPCQDALTCLIDCMCGMQIQSPSTPSMRAPAWESPRAVGGSQGGFIFEDSPGSAGESKDDKLSPGPGGMRGGASGNTHHTEQPTLCHASMLWSYSCSCCCYLMMPAVAVIIPKAIRNISFLVLNLFKCYKFPRRLIRKTCSSSVFLLESLQGIQI